MTALAFSPSSPLALSTPAALPPELAERMAWTLLHSVWQGAALALALAFALRLLRRSTPAVRYRTAVLALVVMGAAGPLTFWALSGGTPATGGRPAMAITPVAPARHATVEAVAPAIGDAAAPLAVPTLDARGAVVQLVVLGWGGGVVLLALWRLGGWLYLRRMLRTARDLGPPWDHVARDVASRLRVNRPVRLAEAAWVAVPSVVGTLRPVVLLPLAVLTGLTPSQVEALLAHELAHVRRHDYLFNLAQTAVETLLFYHPAVWWVSARVREEREHCCDDLAVAACGGDVAGYADALAAMEAIRHDVSSPPFALAASGNPRDGYLLRRVRRLLAGPGASAPAPHRGRPVVPAAVCAFVVALTLGSPALEMRALAQEAETSQDLLRRVKAIYGQNRRAIRSVEIDYTNETNGAFRRTHFARDGDRFRMAGANVADAGVSFAGEVTWDGQVAHNRGWRLDGVKRSPDKAQAHWNDHTPDSNTYHVVRALGLRDLLELGQPDVASEKYRFLRGRTVEDPQHGSCIELEFASLWEDFTLFSRHARRYAYAPVYLRYGKNDGSLPYTELTEARYAEIESDGNTLYYPVDLRILGGGGLKNGGNTFRYIVDESTLKINQPIPRSRFVIEPWPNEELYDAATDKLTRAKDPSWSPIGKVDFPWDRWVEAVEGHKVARAARRQERIATGAVAGGVPRPSLPLAEGSGIWLAVTGVAIVLGGGYVIYRRRHPRQPQTLGRAA